ncbi:MAG: c-type cytochrome [Saprospiraceae bacterium]|jgi:cytochrome c peroxidase|nr:c-type cytochrome [Saprospiraceae bacterium]
MNNKYYFFLLLIIGFVFLLSCEEDTETVNYDSSPYTFTYGGLPTPDLPSDNKLTLEGVKLGRMLFYEPLLSKDKMQSCATCHVQKDGFSDINQFSKGVEGKFGGRQAMTVFNMAWHNNGFFWDGRAPKLRDQALKPIQDPLEMNETLPNAIAKLYAVQKYKDQFKRAFQNGAIDELNLSLALEQFMFSIVSFNSKYDQFKEGKAQLTDSEERGRKLFFTEFDVTGNVKGAECFHCHAGPNFTNDEFMNNGLDSQIDQKDIGRAKVTMLTEDNAKFLTPSLRNIELTAPYMHDGRFKTLEEVVEQYNIHVKNSPTVDFLLQYNMQPDGLKLTSQDKSDLIAFLKTLTDPSFINNAAYSKPN